MQDIKKLFKTMYPKLRVRNIVVEYLENGNFVHRALQILDPFGQSDKTIVKNITDYLKQQGFRLGCATEIEGDFTIDDLAGLATGAKMMKCKTRVIYQDKEFLQLMILDEFLKQGGASH